MRISTYGKRVKKINPRSAVPLDSLYDAGAAFHLIYIDADHRLDAVLVDSMIQGAWGSNPGQYNS